jgi:CheY-like chemotaxis protein
VRTPCHGILIIDDSAPVREVLRIALEPQGYAVIEAVMAWGRALNSTQWPAGE